MDMKMKSPITVTMKIETVLMITLMRMNMMKTLAGVLQNIEQGQLLESFEDQQAFGVLSFLFLQVNQNLHYLLFQPAYSPSHICNTP